MSSLSLLLLSLYHTKPINTSMILEVFFLKEQLQECRPMSYDWCHLCLRGGSCGVFMSHREVHNHQDLTADTRTIDAHSESGACVIRVPLKLFAKPYLAGLSEEIQNSTGKFEGRKKISLCSICLL